MIPFFFIFQFYWWFSQVVPDERVEVISVALFLFNLNK